MALKPVHTYAGKVLLAIDDLAATLIWRNYGISVSAMTGLALRLQDPPRWAKVLGWVLNHIEANHCELAIQDDLWRNEQARAVLGAASVTSGASAPVGQLTDSAKSASSSG